MIKKKKKTTTVKKVTKKVETKVIKVQDFNYWATRPLDDPEKDWTYGEKDWLQGYIFSVEHPHRQLILKALEDFEWSYLLEIGCNVGPNLALIRSRWENRALFGIDASPLAVNRSKEVLGANIEVHEGNYNQLPYPSCHFDVVLADATLLYVSPEEVDQVLSEVNRVVNKRVILVERYADSLKGEVVGHVWGRDYRTLFEKMGYKTLVDKQLTEADWPTSISWQKFGRLFMFQKV